MLDVKEDIKKLEDAAYTALKVYFEAKADQENLENKSLHCFRSPRSPRLAWGWLKQVPTDLENQENKEKLENQYFSKFSQPEVARGWLRKFPQN